MGSNEILDIKPHDENKHIFIVRVESNGKVDFWDNNFYKSDSFTADEFGKIILGNNNGIVYECLGFHTILSNIDIEKIRDIFKKYYNIS